MGGQQGYQIVIVDKNAENRARLREIFELSEETKFRCAEAAAASDAIEICRRENLDCVLLDYDSLAAEIPTVLEKLNPHPAHSEFNILLIAAAQFEDEILPLLQKGAEDYLLRENLSPAKLRLAVKKACENFVLRKADENAERNRLFAEAGREIMIFFRTNGEIVEANRAALNTYGYTHKEFLEKSFYDIRVESSWTAIPAQIEQLEKSGTINFETVHRRKDGSEFPVEANWSFTEVGGEKVILSVINDISERKAAEKSLRESREFAENLVQTAPGILYLFDVQQNANLFLTAQAADVLGYSIEEMKNSSGEFLKNYMHPEDRRRAGQHFEKIKQTNNHGETFEFDYRMRTKTGEWRWFRSRDRVFRFDETGAPREILGVAIDITERREVEEKLELAQASGNAGFFVWSIPEGKTFTTGFLLKMFNADQKTGEFTFEEWISVVHPHDHERILKMLDEAFSKKRKRISYEFRVKTPLTEKWLEAQARIEYDEDGKPLRMTGINYDISARKETEKALLESERQMRAIFNHQFQFSGLLTPEGKVVNISDSALKNFGVKREEVVGTDFLDAPWWRDLPVTIEKWKEQFAEALEKRGTPRSEAPYQKDDGSLAYSINTVTALRDENDEVEYLLVEGMDITDRKRAEEALKKRNEQLDLLSRTSQLLILGKQSEGELLESVFSEVSREIGAEMYFNYKPCDEFSMRLNTWGGLTQQEREHFEIMRYGEKLCGRVALERKPIVIDDIATSVVPGSEIVRAAGYKAYAGFPLIAGDRLVGTIAFVKRHLTHFAEGEVQLIQTVCDQIAATLERIRLMENLHKSEESLRLALDGGKMGTWCRDLKSDRTTLDARSIEIFGFAAGKTEITTEELAAATFSEDLPKILAKLDESIKNHTVYANEFRIRQNNGAIRWIYSTGRASYDENGEPARFNGITHLTQRGELDLIP